MKTKRHGLTINIEQQEDRICLSLKVVGKLTHEDYQAISPMLDSALEGVETPNIYALINGIEFEGWDLRAAWDDFKLGLRHGREFRKIAIVGNKQWQEYSAKIGSWFTSGEVRYFEQEKEALNWLCA